MKRTLRHLVTTIAMIGVATAITILTAQPANAQTRAALVKNVDEPGLVPFSQTFQIGVTACSCSNCCFVKTTTIPAGKRLVIQNVSGWVPLDAVGSLGYINVDQRDGSTSTTILTITPVFRTQWNGGEYPAYEFNQMVLAFVDAGKWASVGIFSGVNFSNFRTGVLTINGYLVNLQ